MRRLFHILCIAALFFGCTEGTIEPEDNTGGIVPDENLGGNGDGGNEEPGGNEETGGNEEPGGNEGGGNEGGGNEGNEGNGNGEGEGGESGETVSFADIEGTWALDKWQGKTPSFSVYMEIGTDGTIILWQKIADYVWEQYKSTAAINSNVISGTYSDHTSWSTSYSIEFEDDNMLWTSTEDESDVSVYIKADLPDDLP